MKKRLLHNLGSGFTYGAVLGMLLFLINTPANASFVDVLKILLVAVICSAVAGIVLAFVFFLVDRFRFRKYNAVREELGPDSILLEEGASRLWKGRPQSGWIFLTPTELRFCSSFQGDPERSRTISVADIKTVEVTDPQRCHITLTLASTEEETFAVTDPILWVNQIDSLE